MKLYSIGELALLSQIKPHTIRIWEQRYQLLVPSRSDGNTRYYSEEQLMKLLNVALLNKNGLKISQISKLSHEDLTEKAGAIITYDRSIELAVDQLMIASLNFDQLKITELFNHYNEQYGVANTFEKIIFPYLRVVGNLWVNGKITPGHEHFFSNLCRLKLFSVIDQLPLVEQHASSVLLSLPEWDYHELGILYYNYVFRKAGYNCTYLGQAVPAADLIHTAKTIKAKYCILTFIGPTTPEKTIKYIETVMHETENVHFYISGPQVNFPISDYKGRLTVFQSFANLKQVFNLNE